MKNQFSGLVAKSKHLTQADIDRLDNPRPSRLRRLWNWLEDTPKWLSTLIVLVVFYGVVLWCLVFYGR